MPSISLRKDNLMFFFRMIDDDMQISLVLSADFHCLFNQDPLYHRRCSQRLAILSTSHFCQEIEKFYTAFRCCKIVLK